MMKKCKEILKKVLIVTLCIVSVSSAIISSIPLARADSSSILGTNKALGSPILNNNFTIEGWNKWEMICWGVFLSNFCQPLIDDYESAFKTGIGGSSGKGYQALVFGTGNDATNNETIEAFCDYAITQQKSTSKREVYVGYTKITDGTLEATPNPNDKNSNANLRPATFNDFFFASTAKAGTTSFTSTFKTKKIKIPTLIIPGSFAGGWINIVTDNANIDGYQEVAYMKEGYIPTFYVTNSSNKYVKILDFTNSWDVQMASAILNITKGDDSSYSQFLSAYESFKNDNQPIELDIFGNLTVANKMLFPAAANQNITKEKKINLLNSWVMNSYVSTYSDDKIILGLEQSVQTELFGIKKTKSSGLPAFGKSVIGNAGVLYYDLDSIVYADCKKDGSTCNYGESVEKLFNLDICSSNNKYPLKFEMADTGNLKANLFGKTKYKDIEATTVAASLLSNVGKVEKQPSMLHELILVDGSKVALFSNKPVIVANQISLKDGESEPTNAGAIRNYYNFLYKAYTGDTTDGTNGKFDQASVKSLLSGSSTIADFYTKSKKDGWSKFQSYKQDYKKTKFPSSFWDLGNNNSINNKASRLCLVYPISDTMKNVSAVLGLRDGTEFSAYSSMLYMTYLDWYGIMNKSTLTVGTESTSEFNEDIYNVSTDVLKVDPSSIADFKSEEDMEKEVLQMGYLLLHPEEGRSYRKEMIYNGISDFMYEQYNRIVYGGSKSTTQASASKTKSGFLAIESYKDNWLTSWFLDAYVDIAVTIIAISCILIVIIGLIKSKRMSWYIFSLFTVINVILLVPSSGDMVPYITSSYIQKIFTNNMTYWSISEDVANQDLEAESAEKMSAAEATESQSVIKLVKQLNTLYTDRSLMLKQDISQKLTQKIGGIYTDIQSIQSARWILPMVMEQFTGDNNTTDYAYVKLSNVWDDGTILHWYYTHEGVKEVTKKTPISQQFDKASNGKLASGLELYRNRDKFFADAVKVDAWDMDKSTDINYANYSYTLKGDPDDITHLCSYILPDNTMQARKRAAVLGAKGENYKNVDSWQAYIDSCKKSFGAEKNPADAWKTNKTTGVAFETVASVYDRTDVSSLRKGQSYFKTTESPYYYFFNVVKDSFDDSKTLGSVIGQLQGEIEKDKDGNEVRTNFMYATKSTNQEEIHGYETKDVEYTGYVRDCLDLQEFFTNTVPYMYEMTLISGGFDGESGVLHDEKITDKSALYEGNLMSWAYRCNWAVKLMENPDYAKSGKIRDKNGKTYEVKNQLLAECYPGYANGRPMIFSEAQMKAYGLKQRDLSLVELKCLEVNKKVAKKWTLLINYAGTSGLTKEVLYRQMATDATTIFNEEFSTSGITNRKYALYPQSIDLRYLSFDSVMKMLLLNVSKDSSYIYGDTMDKLLADSDLITAALLLVAAFFCALVVPLLRMFLMAFIFYLGFLSIIKALFSSNSYKSKIACGQVITNILFIVYTLIYYSLFGALMAISSSDEVLSVKSVSATPGNPVWILIIVIVISVAYIVLMWQQICFCFKHFRDMGFEMYSTIAGAMTSKLTSALGSLQSKLSGLSGGDSGSSKSSTSKSSSSSHSKKSSSSSSSSTTTATTTTKQPIDFTDNGKQPIDFTDTSTSTTASSQDSVSLDKESYTDTNKDYTDYKDDIDLDVLKDIDKEIEAGSKM